MSANELFGRARIVELLTELGARLDRRVRSQLVLQALFEEPATEA